MRMIVTIIMLAGLATGCARTKGTEPLARPIYRDAPASALAFQPPFATELPPMLLDREARRDAAFVGYDEITATYFYIYTDDRQSSDFPDRYNRRSVQYQVGASYR